MIFYLITSALQKEFHHLVLLSLSFKQLHVLTQRKISKFCQMCEEKIKAKKNMKHAEHGGSFLLPM